MEDKSKINTVTKISDVAPAEATEGDFPEENELATGIKLCRCAVKFAQK